MEVYYTLKDKQGYTREIFTDSTEAITTLYNNLENFQELVIPVLTNEWIEASQKGISKGYYPTIAKASKSLKGGFNLKRILSKE